VTVQVYGQDNIDGGAFNPPFPLQMDMDGIQVNERINGLQRTVLPGFHHRPHLFSDGADGSCRHIHAVHFLQAVVYIPYRQSFGIQRDDFVL
jgi:hypothetical protein